MSRRLSVLSTIILVLFMAVAVQAANIQFFRASALDKSTLNPRNHVSSTQFPRGEIVAADGTILAQSVPTGDAFNPYKRIYPLGSLTSGVVGFSSAYEGDWALESEYSGYLTAHAQPPQSVAQLLSPVSAADTVTLTVEPALQKVAAKALGGQDGAAVVLDPLTGNVLAMYSNPTYDPTQMTSLSQTAEKTEWTRINKQDPYGFPPLGLVATQQTFPPGSTFKVVTTAAAVIGRPDLLTKEYPVKAFTKLPDSNKKLFNDGGSACGGDVAIMLPESCDPGYALLGLDIGGSLMASTANAFGYNKIPPLDLPYVASSYFPAASVFSNDLPQLAYSAIGQENVRATALQQAMVASAIADGGVMMTPHLMSYIQGPDGTIVKRYKDSTYLTPLTSSQALQIVPLMQGVVQHGTAAGVGFLAADDVAAKTGTAQTFYKGSPRTDDWMIAFAPATNPTVAVAVVMPYQAVTHYGAGIAGPVVKCLIEGTLALQAGLPSSGTSTTCPS